MEHGILLVRSESCSEEELNRLVTEEGYSIVGEWQEYTLLYKSIAGPLSVLSLEEEAQVFTIPSSADGGFKPDTDSDSDDNSFRGKQSVNEPFTEQKRFFLEMSASDSEPDAGLAASGVKNANLSVEMFVSERKSCLSLLADGTGGDPKEVTLVRIDLGTVTFQVEGREEGTRCLVYQADVEMRPANSWCSREHVFSVEAWPDASDAENQLLLQKSIGWTAELSAGSTGAAAKLGAVSSRAVSTTRALHDWESFVDIPLKSATWCWAISLFSSGRRFEPSKMRGPSFRQKGTAEIISQMLPRHLIRRSVQLSNEKCSAVWNVNAASLQGKELPFDVTLTLHIAVVKPVSRKTGFLQYFGFSTPSGGCCCKVRHSARIPFKLAL